MVTVGDKSKSNTSPRKKKQASGKVSSPSSKGPSGVQKILDICHTMETRNNDPNVPRKMVMSVSGVKSNTFPVTISGMKKKGLIDYDKDFIRLTELGRANATPIAAPVDNETTQAELKEKYKVGVGKAGQLFDILLDGRQHDRATIQATIGCDNKATFAVMICNLKKNGIVEYDRNTIKMSDICFPFGRPNTE